MEGSLSCEEEDNFKTEFKYYKQKAKIPSLEQVVNFENESSLIIDAEKVPSKTEVLHFRRDLRPTSLWEIYHISKVPGLYFIKNAFSLDDQVNWADKCIKEYSASPYVTNLDAFQSKESVDNIWIDSKSKLLTSDGKRDSDFLKETPIWNLRWSTLGYHHDWDSKHYRKDFKSSFPADLGDVCSTIAKVLGFDCYCPEAAIVNFYHVGSTLAPHRDISEADLSLPLISISLGLDAIFLIGGKSKEVKPLPLLIRSGDIVVMSGESRTAYHALARIMTSSRLNSVKVKDDCLSHYLRQSRINLNVRQVESDKFLLP